MYHLGVSAFLAIVKQQNLRAAADSIHVSPSAISHRLKELEQKLGVTLIERRKGIDVIKLSSAGQEFLVLAERLRDALTDIENFGGSEPNLHLNITAPNSMNMYLLPPVYSLIYQRAPRMTFRVHTEHTEESVESVAKKLMDIAFLAREVAIPSNLTMTPFCEEGFCLLRRSQKKQVHKSISLNDLDPSKEIFWRWSGEYQLWHDRTFNSTRVGRVQLDMASLIPDLLVEEQQWAIVVTSVGDWVLKARPNEFSVHQIEAPPPNRKYFTVTHKNPSLEVAEGLKIIDNCLSQLFS